MFATLLNASLRCKLLSNKGVS